MRAVHPVANILGHSLLAGLMLGPGVVDGPTGSTDSSSSSSGKGAKAVKAKANKSTPTPALAPAPAPALEVQSDSDSDIVSVDSQDPDAISANAESTRLRLAKLAHKRLLSGAWGGPEQDGYDSAASNAPDQFPDDMEPMLRVRTARISRGNKVNVRVDGGWMKHPGNEERKGYAVIAAHEAKVKAIGATNPTDSGPMAPEILAILEAHGGDASGLSYNLGAQYKKAIIESAMARAALQPSHPSTHKRKHKKYGEVEKEVDYGRGLQHPADTLQAFQGIPIVAHLPVECGGLRLTVIAPPAVPASLHPICSAGRLCAYCFEQLKGAPSSAEQAPAPKRSKLSKEAAIAEALGYSDVPVRKEFGVVAYYIHPYCLRAMNEGLKACNAPVEDSRDMAASSSSSSASSSSSSVSAFSSRISPGPICDYAESDCSDAWCDLCGRDGGCLQFFDISGITTDPPGSSEGADGWLAHPPCIHWLAQSRLLEPSVGVEIIQETAEKKVSQDPADNTELNVSDAMDASAVMDTDANVQGELPVPVPVPTPEPEPVLVPVPEKEQEQAQEQMQEQEEQRKSDEATDVQTVPVAETPEVTTSREEQVVVKEPEVAAGLAAADLERPPDAPAATTVAPVVPAPPRPQRQRPSQPTRFDALLNQWRCGLCSRHTGIAIRCGAAGCAVRCHPLCVALAGGSWNLCSFHLRNADGTENINEGGQQALGMLCMTHSNHHLYL